MVDAPDLGAAALPPELQAQVQQAMETARQMMEQAPAASPTPDSTGNVVQDRLAQLERLGKLRDDGVLSDAEFEQEKARVLGGG